jgi:sulfite reductase beta subunit-like hemoprotein
MSQNTIELDMNGELAILYAGTPAGVSVEFAPAGKEGPLVRIKLDSVRSIDALIYALKMASRILREGDDGRPSWARILCLQAEATEEEIQRAYEWRMATQDQPDPREPEQVQKAARWKARLDWAYQAGMSAKQQEKKQ